TVGQVVGLLDGHAPLLGEQPDVVEVGARAAPGQHAPGDAPQQHAGGLADAGLDEVDVADAVLLADALHGAPARPGGGAVGGEQRGGVGGGLPGDVVEVGSDGVEEVRGDVGAGQLAVELGAVEVVGPD